MKSLSLFLSAVLLIIAAGHSPVANAASKQELDAKVQEAIQALYDKSSAAKKLAGRAAGMLVFPTVLKAGIGVGGEYGEGALLVGGNTVDYYNTVAASIGFQLGAQSKTQVILFMTEDALDQFRASEGWEVGLDGSVAIANFGAGGQIDSKTVKEPVIGFVLSNKGLMYNLSLEGAKITKIKK